MSHGLSLTPTSPPPPVVRPNESSSKAKSNVYLTKSINELTIDNKSQTSPKKLDSAFIAELKKYLEEKKITKNINDHQEQDQSTTFNRSRFPILRLPS